MLKCAYMISQEEKLQYWLDSAKNDQETAQKLFEVGKYDWCLFLWHLVIERLLKARLTKDNKEVPAIHDLKTLSKISLIVFTPEELSQLIEITSFNISARYDDYKRSFYHKADREYTIKWSQICLGIANKIRTEI